MEISGDEIADVVLRRFDAWESKRKPLKRTNGVREWVPLSGIVAQRQGSKSLTCLAIATGMKCLPQKSITRANGVVLHDWHAEILAIRSFNRFLLEECHALAVSQKKSSEYIRFRDGSERTESHFQPFALRDGINIHMYCSEAPCGDASMELTMASQEDSTPWAMPTATTPSSPPNQSQTPSPTTEPTSLHGRGYFSQLGVVRRKPSRPDAPPTLSKSCTDKIALKQSTSVLSSLTSLLISPHNIYLHSLVLPSSQLSPVAANRAFSPSGRLKPLSGRKWEGGYAFKPFRVISTEKEFEYSRRQTGVKELVSSNISSSWTHHGSETIIGGTLQGRKQFDIKGASRVCKRRMWKLALDVSVLASVPALERLLRVERYADVKGGGLLEGRRRVKEDVRGVLTGWMRNEGGEGFGIEGVER
ncbi:Adenosine-deaminase-containing protein [Venustampulla echinocandica]|uniref:Adenosine-deaminase-containing protein n=1 Tax=Venustampulla echinocandica TaxID=2656787 RepID=A0A370TZT9_9HELO|nr:Adenosine-deaminase-containing protein [Venustampulla echinocandica]RDL41020.1 Adenosine-deaminase-containing protein [Venustampulla echinocandica]